MFKVCVCVHVTCIDTHIHAHTLSTCASTDIQGQTQNTCVNIHTVYAHMYKQASRDVHHMFW